MFEILGLEPQNRLLSHYPARRMEAEHALAYMYHL